MKVEELPKKQTWFQKHFNDEQESELFLRILENLKAQNVPNPYSLRDKYASGDWSASDKKDGFIFDKSIEGRPFWENIARGNYDDAMEFLKPEKKWWIEKTYNRANQFFLLNRIKENVTECGNTWTQEIENKFKDGIFYGKNAGGFNFNDSTEGEDFWWAIRNGKPYPEALKLIKSSKEELWIDKHFTESERADVIARIAVNLRKQNIEFYNQLKDNYYNGIFHKSGFSFSESVEGTRFWSYIEDGNYEAAMFHVYSSKTMKENIRKYDPHTFEPITNNNNNEKSKSTTKHTIVFISSIEIKRRESSRRPTIQSRGFQARLAGCDE